MTPSQTNATFNGRLLQWGELVMASRDRTAAAGSQRKWAIYFLTVWSVANSAALAVNYWPRSPLILGRGAEAALIVLVPISLLSLLIGFVLACASVVREHTNPFSWGTLALAGAILGQLLYFTCTAMVY